MIIGLIVYLLIFLSNKITIIGCWSYSNTIQQINFTGNLDQDGNTRIFFILESKETILNFSQGTVTVFLRVFCFNIIAV